MSSTTEDVAKMGLIRVHDFKTSAERLLSLGYLVSYDQDERPNPQDKGDLTVYECASVKMFGESRMLVRETVDQIAEMVARAGVPVFSADEKYGPDNPMPLTPRKKKLVTG